MSTRVLSNLPPLARPPLPVVQHHHLEAAGLGLHALEWPAPEGARHTVLLLPAAGGHAGGLSVLASELRARGLHVLALDPPGHGLSGGARGGVPMGATTQAIAVACEWAAQHTRRPVTLLGLGLGAWWALHVHLASPHVQATLCHALVLPTLLPMDLRARVLRTRAAATLSRWLPRTLLPLDLLVDPRRVHLDASTRKDVASDPLVLQGYALEAWRSFLTTEPAWPPGSNHKPVLVVVGERDEVVPPAHALRCFMALGGPKAFHVVAGAAHDLARENAPALAGAAADFLGNLPS